MQLRLTKHWNGKSLTFDQYGEVEFFVMGDEVCVDFRLSLKNPSVPSTPIGFTHGLWEHDVFEIFVCGNDGSYIEIEVGPAGHWLVYGFYNYRDQIKDFGERDLKVKTSVNGTIWSGQVCLPKKWLMDSIENCTYNFYQIRKAGKKREYLAWQSIPNIEPDFHRTECFAKIF